MYDFTTEQKEFLSSAGKVVLHACPGSGKTTIVAQKVINYLTSWNRPHQGIAVLSFTNVASEEIARQAREILPQGYDIGTPHFVGTLDSFIDNYIFLRFGYLLLETPKRPLIATNDISNGYSYWRRDCHSNGCVSNIDQFKWEENGDLSKNGNSIDCPGSGRYAPPCIQFKKMMLEKGLFFQNEIAGLTCSLLKKYPLIAKSIAERFPVIILDEAQDTSVEQMEILDLLCEAGLESIFIVGDPDQSIYEWRTADPESFMKKMHDESWSHLTLSKNFRSSQLICNATYVFSDILKDRCANEAKGNSANCTQKPVLLLYENGTSKDAIITRFNELCTNNDIEISADSVAIVTRGKIHSDYDVKDLWKTPETEFLARASYEWSHGNRRKSYEICEKAIFQLVVKPFEKIDVSIEEDVSKVLQYDVWKQMIIDILVSLPSADEACGSWIQNTRNAVRISLENYGVKLRDGMVLADVLKIKSRDTEKPNYKEFPVKVFFEKKIQSEYTKASVHGVKGETYDALLLLIESTRGTTLTPSFLASGDTSKELMRIAYVAMTRPRKLLVVAMPKSRVDLSKRFPRDKWDYVDLT